MKKKWGYILIFILCSIFFAFMFWVNNTQNEDIYAEAINNFESKKQEQALEDFYSIKKYKDSSKYINYIEANNLYIKTEYHEVVNLLEDMQDFKDSQKLVEKAKIRIYINGDYDPSIETEFAEEVQGFEGAKELIEKAEKDKRAEEELLAKKEAENKRQQEVIETLKKTETNTTYFTNKFGTRDTLCVVSGCSNKIASSGDSNCCTTYSNRCLECNDYIDGDASYCISCLEETLKKTETNTTYFTNKFGTRDTLCVVSGCSNTIANSGDSNCCTIHSNRCLECNDYIDGDAAYCMSCLEKTLG